MEVRAANVPKGSSSFNSFFFLRWGKMMGGLGQENKTQLAETLSTVFSFSQPAPDVGACNPSCFIERNGIFS